MKISRVRTMFALGAGIDWHTEAECFGKCRTAYNIKLFLGQIVVNFYLYSKWRGQP